jgi:hypothetical protein
MDAAARKGSLQDLRKLIKQEQKFFLDILQAQASLTDTQKAIYRHETVLERRLRISSELFQKFNGVVQTGPFKGLKLNPVPAWGTTDLPAMLLGCYEPEVLKAMFSKPTADLSVFVNLGTADGYYVSGGLYSQRFRSAYGFETTLAGREATERAAALNGVRDRLNISGTADSKFFEQLHDVRMSDVFLLCDIEGGEFEVFDEHCLKSLRGATIIIEIHNWTIDFWSKYEKLLVNASKFFSITTLSRVSSTLPKVRGLQAMHDDNRALMLSEGRPNIMRYLKLSSAK